ncbi:MAG TPA: M23 family metallopeptidase [Polyangium sp.]|nr:M23 family metallopeptidase [Polyangium sp.]
MSPKTWTFFVLLCAFCVQGCSSTVVEPKTASSTAAPAPPNWVVQRLVEGPREMQQSPVEAHLAKTAPASEMVSIDKPIHPQWPKGTTQSKRLPSGLFNPMPGGVISGYRADTGLDVMGIKMPVYAIASGFIDYAETGHTLWTGPRDTANCVRIELDEPIAHNGRRITHIYYAHLSKLALMQAEGKSPRTRVEAGDLLGISGVANGSWHLHLGFLLDGEVEQYWGTFLYEDEIRLVMGGYRNGNRLPKE